MGKHNAAKLAALALTVLTVLGVPVSSTAGPIRELGEQQNPPLVKVCSTSGCVPTDEYAAVINCITTTCPVTKDIHLSGFSSSSMIYVKWVEVLAPSELTYNCTPDDNVIGQIAVHDLGSTSSSILSASLPPVGANPKNLGWVCAHIGTAGFRADEVPVLVIGT